MEVQIIRENQIENKVYFELIPIEIEFVDKLKFGKEIEIDYNDLNALEAARIEVMNEAKSEFEKTLNK